MPLPRNVTRFFLSALLIDLCLMAVPMPVSAEEIRVVGTELQIMRANEVLVSGADLVGAVITFSDTGHGTLPLRIDAVDADPLNPADGILLYRFMQQDTESGKWRPFCARTHDGHAAGFPLNGIWNAEGRYYPSRNRISLICANSAVGKCLRRGYRLWGSAADGTPLRLLHQTCTRILRADYCGDGSTHTQDGIRIQIRNRLELQRDDAMPNTVLEAIWGPDGAHCLRSPRLSSHHSLEGLTKNCPRLRGKTGDACHADMMPEMPEALLLSYRAQSLARNR